MGNATLNATSSLAGEVGALARPENFISWGSYFQAIAVLCLILAAMWFILWLLKKRFSLPMLGLSNDLRVEARLPLGPKKSLLVVRILNKRLLLGVTDQQISLLTELPDEDQPDDDTCEEPKSEAFTDILAGLRNNRPT